MKKIIVFTASMLVLILILQSYTNVGKPVSLKKEKMCGSCGIL